MADKSKKIDLILRISPIIPQVHSKCCWLACYGMVYGWKGKPYWEVKKKIAGAGISMNDALYSDQWDKARSALGLKSVAAAQLGDLKMVTHCLVNHGPLWCAGDFLKGRPHAVLVSGIYYGNESLRIHDPYKLALPGGDIETMGHKMWYRLLSKRAFSCQMLS